MKIYQKHFRKFLTSIILLIFPGIAQAWTYSEVTKIGLVRVYTNKPGISGFERADGANFAHCTNSPHHMYSDFLYYTPEGIKAALAVLLTAKATDKDVTVYYNVDSDGYCRFELVDIK